MKNLILSLSLLGSFTANAEVSKTALSNLRMMKTNELIHLQNKTAFAKMGKCFVVEVTELAAAIGLQLPGANYVVQASDILSNRHGEGSISAPEVIFEGALGAQPAFLVYEVAFGTIASVFDVLGQPWDAAPYKEEMKVKSLQKHLHSARASIGKKVDKSVGCTEGKELHQAIMNELTRRQPISEALFTMKDPRATQAEAQRAKEEYDRLVTGEDNIRLYYESGSLSAVPVADLIREQTAIEQNKKQRRAQ